MIGFIPLIDSDYILTAIYLGIIFISFKTKMEKRDITVFMFGFIIMIVPEYLFISTGVETFLRNSLFGIMPLWLPFLWGYGFVAISRGVSILNREIR
jgi:hypothetical protein